MSECKKTKVSDLVKKLKVDFRDCELSNAEIIAALNNAMLNVIPGYDWDFMVKKFDSGASEGNSKWQIPEDFKKARTLTLLNPETDCAVDLTDNWICADDFHTKFPGDAKKSGQPTCWTIESCVLYADKKLPSNTRMILRYDATFTEITSIEDTICFPPAILGVIKRFAQSYLFERNGNFADAFTTESRAYDMIARLHRDSIRAKGPKVIGSMFKKKGY